MKSCYIFFWILFILLRVTIGNNIFTMIFSPFCDVNRISINNSYNLNLNLPMMHKLCASSHKLYAPAHNLCIIGRFRLKKRIFKIQTKSCFIQLDYFLPSHTYRTDFFITENNWFETLFLQNFYCKKSFIIR